MSFYYSFVHQQHPAWFQHESIPSPFLMHSQVLPTSWGVLLVISSTLSTIRWIRTWRSPSITTSLPPHTTLTCQETSCFRSPEWKCTPMFSRQAAVVWKVKAFTSLHCKLRHCVKGDSLTLNCLLFFSLLQWTAGMGLMGSLLFIMATLWHPKFYLKMSLKQLTSMPSQNHSKSFLFP